MIQRQIQSTKKKQWVKNHINTSFLSDVCWVLLLFSECCLTSHSILSARNLRQQLHHNAAHMSSHCQPESFVRQDAAEKPQSWQRSHYEAANENKIKKCHWQQLQEGRHGRKTDSGLDKYTHTYTHSQEMVPDCTRGGAAVYFALNIELCLSLWTTCFKDKRLQRWKCQSVWWLNTSHPSLREISAAQHLQKNAAFKSKILPLKSARVLSVVIFITASSNFFRLLLFYSTLPLIPAFSPITLLFLPPSKSLNSIQKGNNSCCPDEHNYRGCCQCG